MLDSSAKFPDGAMNFHIVLLGNIEECIDISVPAQIHKNETLEAFTGKYVYTKVYVPPKNKDEKIVIVVPGFGDSLGALAQVFCSWMLGLRVFELFQFLGCWSPKPSNLWNMCTKLMYKYTRSIFKYKVRVV